MIEGPIKITPERWAPPGAVEMNYVAPDGSFWNVSSITGKYLQLWTVDSWGTVKPDSVSEVEFREKWSEKPAAKAVSPGRKVKKVS